MRSLLTSIIVLASATISFAVTLQITPAPGSTAVCPGTYISYTVSNAGGGALPNCIYHWSAVGATFQSGVQTGTTVWVAWNDQTGTGTLTVTATGCSPSSDNGSNKSATYTRLSVFGLNFPSGVCNDHVDIPICSPGVGTICVNRMYVAGTGGVGQPALKEVDRYIFTIPSGWKSGATNGPANITTTSNSISIEPLANNPSGGTVSVVGSVSNSCGGTNNSNPTVVNLVRTPTIVITPPVGYNGAACGLRQPVTFTATSLPCATGYTWTIPSGWTGSSTTNTITLTPNGTSGGTLSVVIALSGGGSVSASYVIPYSPNVPTPTLSGDPTYEYCNNETFTLTANVPAGYASNFGFDWYATPTVTINGSSPTQASPLHTTSNSVSVTIPGSNFGPQTIAVRMNNLSCTPSNYVSVNKRVGPYSNSEFTIIGPSTICANQVADFRPNFITPDLTGYQWSAPAGWSNTGQGTPYFSVSVPAPATNGAITLRLQNRCGLTNTPYVLNLTPGTCFSFTYSPNPATETLQIQHLSPNEEASATLIDKNNRVFAIEKSNNGKIEIDLSRVPNGLYILTIKQHGDSESKRIIVSH